MFYSIWWPRPPGDTSDVPPQQVREKVDRHFLGTVWEDLNILRYQEYIENPALSRVDARRAIGATPGITTTDDLIRVWKRQ